MENNREAMEKLIENSLYDEAAKLFLKVTNTELTIEYIKHGLMDWDKEGGDTRDIYRFILKVGNRIYVSTYGNSIVKSQRYIDKITKKEYSQQGTGLGYGNSRTVTQRFLKEECRLISGTLPTVYDILSCLTWYDTNTFEDFCATYGYDEDSRQAEKTYLNIKSEYTGLCALYSENEMELGALIQ